MEDRRPGRRVAAAGVAPTRIDATASARSFTCDCDAGRAIPMEFHFVLLRALALCYPAVFHVHERRPAPTRRSARVAAAAAAAER